MAVTSFTFLEIAIPAGYLLFSVWTAYTSGYNMAMMKKHKPKGAGKYGPYLGGVASFAGIAIMLFLGLDALAYETGFIRADLPQDLYNLDFFTFLLRQFGSIRFTDVRYVVFITLGVVLAIALAYLITRTAFDYGKGKIEKE